MQALADDIVNIRLPPGVRLDEQTLALRFGTSRTPIREALGQLAASGLVDKRPRRGAIVVNLSPGQIVEMFEVMAELEGVCARLAAERMTAAERSALAALHESSRPQVNTGDREAYEAHNRRFHAAIYEGSHNQALCDTTLEARRRVAPFRRAQFWVIGRLASSFDEHGEIVAAILDGRSDDAAACSRRHLSRVGGASTEFVHGARYLRDGAAAGRGAADGSRLFAALGRDEENG